VFRFRLLVRWSRMVISVLAGACVAVR